MGMNVTGVKSDLRSYQIRTQSVWNFRELLATPVALWQVWISHPEPVLGEKEPIFPQAGTGETKRVNMINRIEAYEIVKEYVKMKV